LDQEQHPRLALLDLCLPDGDGVQLADALMTQHPGLPLILMTAYPLRLRENRAAADRFVRVLTKPLNVSELRQTIEASLSPAAASVATSPSLSASLALHGGASPIPTRSTGEEAGVTPAVSLPHEVPAMGFFRA